MSPEQVRGEELDARTDLFSFGAVLYEMATGRLAFSETTSGVIFDAILNRAPTPPVRLNPELPAELERIVDKALEKDRRLRYQGATDLRTDLKRLKRETDSAHAIAGVAQRTLSAKSRKRWLLPISLGVLLALAIGGLGLLPQVQQWFRRFGPAQICAGLNRQDSSTTPVRPMTVPRDHSQWFCGSESLPGPSRTLVSPWPGPFHDLREYSRRLDPTQRRRGCPGAMASLGRRFSCCSAPNVERHAP
jgi:serine/threonine protein kinase